MNILAYSIVLGALVIEVDFDDENDSESYFILPVFDGTFASTSAGKNFVDMIKELGLRLSSPDVVVLPSRRHEDKMYKKICNFEWDKKIIEKIEKIPGLIIAYKNDLPKGNWKRFDPREHRFIHINLEDTWDEKGFIRTKELARIVRTLKNLLETRRGEEEIRHAIIDDKILRNREDLIRSVGLSLTLFGINLDVKNIIKYFSMKSR